MLEGKRKALVLSLTIPIDAATVTLVLAQFMRELAFYFSRELGKEGLFGGLFGKLHKLLEKAAKDSPSMKVCNVFFNNAHKQRFEALGQVVTADEVADIKLSKLEIELVRFRYISISSYSAASVAHHLLLFLLPSCYPLATLSLPLDFVLPFYITQIQC